MIEFLTLFLTLTTGVRSVELVVSGPVDAIEVRLDGERVAALVEPPWRFEFDLGPELLPHELEATAFDDKGRMLDQAATWINLGLRDADAFLRFESDANGWPRAARVVWESSTTRTLRLVEVTFDGESLESTDPQNIPFPAYDTAGAHFLEVQVETDDRRHRLAASFGGVFGEDVTTELSALPVRVERRGGALKPEKIAGWFRRDGEPLRVHAVDRGPAEIVIVRDPSARRAVGTMAGLIMERHLDPSLSRSAWKAIEAFRKDSAAFAEPTGINMASPLALPITRDQAVTDRIFPRSERRRDDSNGVLWLSQQMPPSTFRARLADAVAVAGNTAQACGCRRAVVLLLGDGTAAAPSVYSPAAVRDYLAALRVPFEVWSFTSREPHPDWGEVRYVGSGNGVSHNLAKAVRDLESELQRQRIVWLEGRHPPQTLELSAESSKLRLAGVPDGGTTRPATLREPESEDPAAPAAVHQDGAPRAEDVTTLVITVTPSTALPEVSEMRDWFYRAGEALEVLEIEHGDAHVTFVRDPAVQDELALLAYAFYGNVLFRRQNEAIKTEFENAPFPVRESKSEAEPEEPEEPEVPYQRQLDKKYRRDWLRLDPRDVPANQAVALAEAQRQLPDFAALDPATSVRFLSPIAAPGGHVGSDRELFWVAGSYSGHQLGVLTLADEVSWFPGEYRIADALIAAAQELEQQAGRRALVLFHVDGREDESLHPPAAALRRLEVLGVPLFVWSSSSAPHPVWGEPRSLMIDLVESMSRLGRVDSFQGRNYFNYLTLGVRTHDLRIEDAAAELREHLASQRLVRLRGRHPIAEIELGADARGIALAGGLVPRPSVPQAPAPQASPPDDGGSR